MSHVTSSVSAMFRLNESRHSYKRVTSHTEKSRHAINIRHVRVWRSHVTHTSESYHIAMSHVTSSMSAVLRYGWIMSLTWMGRVIYERVTSHYHIRSVWISRSHITHTSESCHIRMNHVTSSTSAIFAVCWYQGVKSLIQVDRKNPPPPGGVSFLFFSLFKR